MTNDAKDRFLSVVYPRIFIAIVIGLLFLPAVKSYGKVSERSFWRRDDLVAVYANVRLFVFKDRVFENVLVGQNRWLIYTSEGSMDDYQKSRSFSEERLAAIQGSLDALNDRLKAQGIVLLVVIPPDKNTIYPELVPPEIPVIGKESRLDQFMAYMKVHGETQVIDFRAILLEARSQHLICYPYDSHWNEYGAFIAYQEIMFALNKEFPQIIPHPISDFRMITGGDAGLDLALNIGTTRLAADRVELEPLFDSQTTYEVTRLGRRRLTVSSNPDPTLPTAVIYHDSFFFRLIPLVGEHFSRAVYVPHFSSGDIWNLSWIDQEKPDVVILEFAERYLDAITELVGP